MLAPCMRIRTRVIVLALLCMVAATVPARLPVTTARSTEHAGADAGAMRMLPRSGAHTRSSVFAEGANGRTLTHDRGCIKAACGAT